MKNYRCEFGIFLRIETQQGVLELQHDEDFLEVYFQNYNIMGVF